MDYLTTNTSPSPIRHGFAPGFVNYKKGCPRLAVASDKVYQLLVNGRWFSPGTPASSTTKTGRHDIAEIFLKVALNTKNKSINQSSSGLSLIMVNVRHFKSLSNYCTTGISSSKSGSSTCSLDILSVTLTTMTFVFPLVNFVGIFHIFDLSMTICL